MLSSRGIRVGISLSGLRRVGSQEAYASCATFEIESVHFFPHGYPERAAGLGGPDGLDTCLDARRGTSSRQHLDVLGRRAHESVPKKARRHRHMDVASAHVAVPWVLLIALVLGSLAACRSETPPEPPTGIAFLPLDHGLGAPCSSDIDCIEGLSCPSRPLGAQRFCAEEGFQYVAPATFDPAFTDHAEQDQDADPDVRHVTLSRAYLLQIYEVTQGEWLAMMGSNPSRFQRCGHDCPVERVTWLDAIAYANERSTRADLLPCYDDDGTVRGGGSVYDCAGYRLPTEAEWVHARGVLRDDVPFESRDNEITWTSWHGMGRPQQVGGRPPNHLGLYDMFANVMEWTHDRYQRTTSTGNVTDPEGARVGSFRIIRGNSTRTPTHTGSDRSFTRGYLWRHETLGFRLARTVPRVPRFD